jgi:high-affinity nickel permease
MGGVAMTAFTVLSLGVSAVLFVMSLILKIAGKARLTIPVLYVFAASISTLFTDWTTKHETLVIIGLCVIIGLVVFSWFVSLIRVIRSKRQERFEEDDVAWQIRRAGELGVPLDNVTFDTSGNLIDPRTGKPVVFGEGVKFY